MRKKIVLPIVLILLLVAGVLGLLFISGIFEKEDVTPVDTAALAKENADTAFSFLEEKSTPLPENMKGYIIDFETDIDMTDTSEDALKAAVYAVFEKVDAVLPDTIVVRLSDGFNYSPDGFDALACLITAARENGMYTVLLTTDDVPDSKKAAELAEKYAPDGIMTAMTDFSQSAQQKATETKTALAEKNVSFGILVHDAPTEEAVSFAGSNIADFCFVQLNTALSEKSLSAIQSWAQTALVNETNFYAILRNDLVRSGGAWTDADEIYNQVRALYNYGGFAGCVMFSHGKLASNDSETTADLYFYNEYFNDIDYTALTINSYSIENDSTVIIEGTSDKNYPIHTRSSRDGRWNTVTGQGDDGAFRAEISLRDGTNEITIKHKNAMYTYCIDKAVDVMTSHSAVISDGKLTLSATAVNGARVWASVANTQQLELTASSDGADGYTTYTAEYEIPAEYSLLTDAQVSFAAEFNGIKDIDMCGEKKAMTPYDDHGLGSATMCIVTKNYAETTSTASPDDTSDPTCTPQLEGACAYISECSVKDNIVVYSTDTGMKIHGEHSKLILGGYKMPENTIRLNDVTTDDNTSLTFSFDWLTFIKAVVAPQEYYIGTLDRIYNVEEFTGEYIDILFMNTNECGYITEPDFSTSNVISKAEWYSNSEDGFMTLRLYFKEKGDFAGYSIKANTDGTVTVSLKKTADTLEGTVIMLDPGHGGYGAPGTYSTSSVYEHEVTYSIAEKTAEILRKYGATVIVTRGDNEALFLSERVDMIREQNPDVFVSIHCDGSENESWFGTHTFYYKNYSMPLADAIHTQLVKAYRSYVYTDTASEEYADVDVGCKFFPYMVTRVEECPSVLVECGYLTNPADAAFLTSQDGQLVTATAIAQGIADYFAES